MLMAYPWSHQCLELMAWDNVETTTSGTGLLADELKMLYRNC